MTEQEQQIQQEQKIPNNVNTGLISLEIVARMNNVDIDMRGIVREYGISTADIPPEEIIRIAKSKGFKIKRKNIKLKDISAKYPMPAIIQLKDNTYRVYFKSLELIKGNSDYRNAMNQLFNWNQNQSAQNRQHDDFPDSLAGLITNVLNGNKSKAISINASKWGIL